MNGIDKAEKRRHRIKLILIAAFLLIFPNIASAETAVDTGITSWMLTSTALVLLMVPGLALFYGGLVRTKNVLGTMMHCFVAMAIIGVLWAVCGYAFSFGPSVLGGWIGWDPNLILLAGIDETITEAGIPEYAFAMFQGKFAIITPALIAGAFAAAPITSLTPVIGAGYVTAFLQVMFMPPVVKEFETVLEDMGTLKGWWKNN